MQKIFTLFISTILLIGCGGGSSSATGESADEDVSMELNKAYTVYPGNKLIKGSTLAQVNITHEDGQTTSTVTLLDGNATIIRNP